MCLALALKKLSGEEWMIKSQDSPDIVLVKISNRFFYNHPFDGLRLEIMEISEKEKQGFGENVEGEVAEYIRNKKFMKRYQAGTCLLVHFNFNQMGFDLKKVSEKLQSFPNNPYNEIWTRLNASPNAELMNISRLYPEFLRIDIDVVKEYLNLMF